MVGEGVKILVVMPARNEEGRVGVVVRGARASVPAASVLVVDDCSTDATRQEALAAGATVISHPVNLGYGAALESGYLYAAAWGYEVVLQMDSDGQHLPEELPALLGPVAAGEADLVLGCRRGGAEGGGAGLARRLGRRLFGAMIRLLTGMRVEDPTTGFQGLGRRALRLFSSGFFPEDYPDADVLIIAHYAGLRIRQVPVRMAPRGGGESMHSGLKPVYYGMKMVLSMLLARAAARRWRKYAS